MNSIAQTSHKPSPPQTLPFQALGQHVEIASLTTKKRNCQSQWAYKMTAQSSSERYCPTTSHLRRGGISRILKDGVVKLRQHRKQMHHTQLKFEIQSMLQQHASHMNMAGGQFRPIAQFDVYINYVKRINMVDPAIEDLDKSDGIFVGHKALALNRGKNAIQRDMSDKEEHDFDSDFLQKAIKRATDSLNNTHIASDLPQYLQGLGLTENLSTKRALPRSLSIEDLAEIAAALKKRGIVAKLAQEQLSDNDLASLNPGQWLKHEIINFYGGLLMARSREPQRSSRNLLSLHYFRTSFFSKLAALGYEKARLANRTQNIDIFERDIILIPVNFGDGHWTCAAINFKRKRIEHYDSKGQKSNQVYECLRDYLEKEHSYKKKADFDWAGWQERFSENAPKQEKDCDSGVFSCQYMECISRGAGFRFSASSIPHLRQRMILEIMRGRLWDQWPITGE